MNGARSQVDLRGFGATANSNTLFLINGRRVQDLDMVGVDLEDRCGPERPPREQVVDSGDDGVRHEAEHGLRLGLALRGLQHLVNVRERIDARAGQYTIGTLGIKIFIDLVLADTTVVIQADGPEHVLFFFRLVITKHILKHCR